MWDRGNTPNAQKCLKPRYIKKLVTTRATQSDFRRRGELVRWAGSPT